MHLYSLTRFKRRALAHGTGLLVCSLAMAAFAAPDDKPKTTATRVSPKFKGKLRPGGKVNGGGLGKRPLVKHYKWVNGQMVEIYDGSNSGPEPTATPAPPRVATGRRVRISARMVVTNSEDGWNAGLPPTPDNTVELSGSVFVGNATAFIWMGQSAKSGKEFTSMTMPVVTLRYNDPNLHFFPVKGKLEDVDRRSAWDGMWLASQNIDLLQIMESNSEFLIKGDRSSENADLYIRVTDAGEVFN